MERGEQRAEGYKYSIFEIARVTEAFIPPGKRVSENDPDFIRERKATDFLRAVETKASQEGMTLDGSVDVIITANLQESSAALSTALDDLTQTAANAGFHIDIDATHDNPGSVLGKIALKKAPDLAIGIYKNPNTFILELQRPRPLQKSHK